jgi:DNA-3-methyladenine glycosylase
MTSIEELSRARLPPDWFHRDVIAVAKELVGCALVHRKRAGMIVETEAYLGPDDLASHARFGPTSRTSVMFGPGGISYVYLCYGIHQMFNIVTGREGEGQAVLIRAIAPLVGLPDEMRIGSGPGLVTKALRLDRRHDRKDLATGQLYVAGHDRPPALATGPRVGVDYAGDWAAQPLRFWWKDHPAVSRPPRKKDQALGTVATTRKR